MATRKTNPEVNLGVFNHTKDTKNMVRFDLERDGQRPLSIYVPKEEVTELGTPASIEVVLRAV